MPWIFVTSAWSTIATRFLRAFGSLILYGVSCVGLWSTFCSSLCGHGSRIGYRWSSEEGVTEGGRLHLPSSLSWRDGTCCSGPRTGWSCCVRLAALIWSLGVLCSRPSASSKTPPWTQWTRCARKYCWHQGSNQLVLLLAGALGLMLVCFGPPTDSYALHLKRSIRGAWKLGRHGVPTQALLNVEKALTALMLPGLLSVVMLSCGIYLIASGLLKAHRHPDCWHDTPMCPARALGSHWQVFHAAHTTAAIMLQHASLLSQLDIYAMLQAQGIQAVWVSRWAFRNYMVERLAGDSSSEHEYVNMMNDSDPEAAPGEEARAGDAGTARPHATRVIYDRLGQVVREPTGPPPIVLEAGDDEAAEEAEDGESSEHADDEIADEHYENHEDSVEDPLQHGMTPEDRHVSLAMAQAICEVLRRNGNSRTTFHVLCLPPTSWRTTEGFILQARPLTTSAMRHPCTLRCSDGPTFAPPRFVTTSNQDTSEMTDAEMAEEAELMALRAELEEETDTGLHRQRGSSMTSGTATPRTRRQPWPSRYAPPVPTPARTSREGSSAESSRQGESEYAQANILCRRHMPPFGVVSSGEVTRTEGLLRISEAAPAACIRQKTEMSCLLLLPRHSAGRPKISLLARALHHLDHRIHLHSMYTKRLTRYCSKTSLCAWSVSLPSMPQIRSVIVIACLLRSFEIPAYLQVIWSAALFYLMCSDCVYGHPLSACRWRQGDPHWQQAGQRGKQNLHTHMSMTGDDEADHQPDLPQQSCSGPKSRGYSQGRVSRWQFILMMLLMLPYQTRATVADARVELPVHRWSSGAGPMTTPVNHRAKPGESRHNAPSSYISAQGHIRKRALRRAIERAHKNADGCTWYRGRRLHHRQLWSGQYRNEQVKQQPGLPNHREARNLRVISWNTGGLHSDSI